MRRASRVGTIVGLLAFALLLCGLRPAIFFDRGPFSSDFFDAQAHALLDGRLDVDPEIASIEGFVVDGRTYLYFGLVPALLRLPVAAVTDSFDGRLSRLSLLGALAVGLWASNRLLARGHRAIGRDGTGRGDRLVAFGFPVVVATSSPLLWLGARPLVYHEAELWGAALALVALDRFLEWWERPHVLALGVAAAAATVALSARPSVGSAPVIALAIGGVLRRPYTLRRTGPVLAAVTLAVLPYAAVNQARFGMPLSVPYGKQVFSDLDANRQAALEANGGNLFSASYVPTALIAYLRPDGIRLQRLPPWITYAPAPPIVGEPVFDTVDRTASIPVVAPALCLFAGLGAVRIVRRRAMGWAVATGAAALSVVPALAIGFIANRYLADFTPLLLVPAALGVWWLADLAGSGGRLRRRASLAGTVGLTAIGALVGVALAIQGQRLHLLPTEAERRGFVAFQYDVDRALFGGRPPNVSQGPLPGDPGSWGAVRIVGPCEGLYWSDGTYWFPLERGARRGRLLHPRAVLRSGRVVDGGTAGWSVDLVVDGRTARFAYRGSPSDTVGATFGADALDAGLVLIADPAHGELQVRLDDRRVLELLHVDVSDISVSDGWRSEPLPTPLCDELRARSGSAQAGSSS